MPEDHATPSQDSPIDAAWALVNALADQPREAPGDANKGADLIVDALSSAGLSVRVYEPDLYLSRPLDASVQAGGTQFAAKVPAFAAHRPDGVTGDLVFLEDASGGTPLDRNPAAGDAQTRAAGKIAIIEGFALPNFIAGLEAAGALAVIAVNPGERIHWGTVSTIWGTPEPADLARLPRIPSAAVNRADGDRLIALARDGASATVRTELETGWFPQKLPMVEIRGAQTADDFVLLHGHYDSWREGVGDNGTGNACMLGVAHALWAQRDKLHRSVRIAWWPGHSTGRYGGSAWFADTFALDLDAHCVAHLNCDSPGCRWATSYETISCMSEAAPVVAEIVAKITGQTATRKRPQRNSDFTFNNIGITGLFSASSMMTDEKRDEMGYYVVGGCGGNVAWHTEDDTLEIADRDVLDRDIALYTEAVMRLAGDAHVPMDWRAGVSELRETADKYARAAGDAIDLTPVTQALDRLADALEAMENARAAGKHPTAAVNDVNRRLSRILVPLNYVRGPRFSHDPALNVPPLPALALAVGLGDLPADRRGFALAALLRGRNYCLSAISEAEEVIALCGR